MGPSVGHPIAYMLLRHGFSSKFAINNNRCGLRDAATKTADALPAVAAATKTADDFGRALGMGRGVGISTVVPRPFGNGSDFRLTIPRQLADATARRLLDTRLKYSAASCPNIALHLA